MKRYVSLLLVVAMILSLSGCGKTNTKKNNKKSGDKIQIGFTMDTFVMERWERDRDIFLSKANELGADVNIQSANGDIEEQKKQIKYFIDQGVDVIVIVPIDCQGLTEEVKAAKDAGIKVISYDRMIQNVSYDLYISFDNTMVGTLMGESLEKAEPKSKNVIMVSGPTTDSNVIMVDDGFRTAINDKGYKIVDITYIENWKQNLAYDYINSHFDKVKGANIIMCGNDALAGQVITALLERGMADDYIVLGQDSDLDACQRIVEGTQYMTVYKPIDELAAVGAVSAVKLAKGETLEYTSTLNNGSDNINYIGINPYMVTKENMDSVIIESGFHLKDEVYLNVKDEKKDN